MAADLFALVLFGLAGLFILMLFEHVRLVSRWGQVPAPLWANGIILLLAITLGWAGYWFWFVV